jgi:hypothetical protein
MMMPDVNILVYAHREESPEHLKYARWLTELATGREPFALSETVMEGFIRVVTNSKIFKPASTTEQAMLFLNSLMASPRCVRVRAGARHWDIFAQLCAAHSLRGAMIADASHAALAIENGCEWVSADTDFARFAPLLRWRHL